MTENVPSEPVDVEESSYLVTLAIEVTGYDPVDAVDQALRILAREGLVNQTFLAYSEEEEQVYVVPPGGEDYHLLSDVEDEDGESDVPVRLEDLLGQVDAFLKEAREAGLLDGDDELDSDDLDEPEAEPDPEPVIAAEKPKRAPRKKPAAEAAKTASCPRCKTSEVTIVKDGLCQDCLDDIQGGTE